MACARCQQHSRLVLLRGAAPRQHEVPSRVLPLVSLTPLSPLLAVCMCAPVCRSLRPWTHACSESIVVQPPASTGNLLDRGCM